MPLSRTLSLIIASLLCLGRPALADEARHPTPAPAVEQLPPARIKATVDAYRRWLDTLERRDKVAGLATAVVVGDRVVFEGTIGYADAKRGEKVSPTTVFRLASLSKAFATALTAILVQNGKLAWDTRLVNVLPFFKLRDMPDTQRATVADILGQRLGLPRNTYDNKLEDHARYEELVRQLDQVKMTCEVGKCYGYQNVAFSLIGDIVYAMTGDFFYHSVDRHIFLPLGMKTASYGREALESSKSWARPHYATRHGWVPFEPKEDYYRVAPAAGVNASLRDMERWLAAQMGERPDVLSPAMLRALHSPGVSTPVELHSTTWRRARLTSAHYALGWRVFTYGGETLIYHAGAVQGYRTMIGFFPRYRVGVVTLWNAGVPSPSGLMPMVFDSLLGLPHVDWADLEGKHVPKNAAPARSTHRARRHRRHR